MPAPIVHQDLSGLAQGLTSAGNTLSQVLQRQSQEGKQKQYGSILESSLGALSDDASPLDVSRALSSAMAQGVPVDVAQQQTALFAALQKGQRGQPPSAPEVSKIAGLFEKFGMKEEEAQRNAELWGVLTTGGQTEMAKYLVDQITRQDFSQQADGQGFAVEEVVEEGVVGPDQVSEFAWPKLDIFEGLTPKEKVSREKDLFNANAKDFAEVTKKQKGLRDDQIRVDQLRRYNDSGKLPQGMDKLNINWSTGDIRFPALANAETQGFVKTINDFTIKAKDTFGARVTNFELGSFMKRLPTMANSEEGRRLIIEQMSAMQDLDRLHYDSLEEVYNKYGLRKIDSQKAEQIAKELRAPKEEELKKNVAESVQAQDIYEARSLAPEGKVPARGPNGNIVYVWMNQADKAEKQGYKLL